MIKFALIFYCFIVIGFEQGASKKQRIMNGTEATRGQFPFMISIQLPYERRNICGGALISAGWVMTAAHCTRHLYMHIVLIAGLLDSVDFDEGYQVRRVKSAHFPGEYPAPGNEHDISLVQPTELFSETQFIKFLPYQRCNISLGDHVTIMGWGIFNQYGEAPKILQWASAEVNQVEICGGDENEVLTSVFTCIRGNKKLSMARQGDSGSPGIYNGKIFGVVSMGIPKDSYGAYYTKTSTYHDWILRTIGKGSVRTLRKASRGCSLFDYSIWFYVCLAALLRVLY